MRWIETMRHMLPLVMGLHYCRRLGIAFIIFVMCAFRTALVAVLLMTPLQMAWGQGCIVSRSNGDVGGPESQGGYLAPGDFSVNIGYRHQFSFRHFIGDVEQPRIALGTQVENKLNLENLAITYQITHRFSVTADLPVMSASRHTNNTSLFYTTDGIGDTAFMVNGWVWNPEENTRGNVQLGVGLLVPSGTSNASNLVNGQPKYVDYSIQPGQGGWGIPLQWASYKNVQSFQVFFNGSYTAMVQDLNTSYLRSNTVNPVTMLQYTAISDQYLAEGGVAHAVSRIKGLTVTLGPRWEGVPSKNLFPGENLGFRRPGYALSIEPGAQLARGKSVFSVQVGRALYRNRTVSVPDALTNGHGDAAFADWVWLASYSYRFSRPGKSPGHHPDMNGHSADQPNAVATK
jgi:hypothetical protein